MLVIKKLLSFFLLFFLSYSHAIAIETCDITKTIETDQWTQIGIPCEAPPAKNTVEAIIADDISGIYGTDWVMFSFNSVANAYNKMKLEDILHVGRGYWIIQLKQPATLDMPANSQLTTVKYSRLCFTERCFESRLMGSNLFKYQMIANPFHHTVEGTDIRVVNIHRQSALTLQEAEDQENLANKLWSYNGVTGFDELQNQAITPWTGMWVVSYPNAKFGTLLFPTNNSVEDESIQPPKLILGTGNLDIPAQGTLTTEFDMNSINYGGNATFWSIDNISLTSGHSNFSDEQANETTISIDSLTGKTTINWPPSAADVPIEYILEYGSNSLVVVAVFEVIATNEFGSSKVTIRIPWHTQ